jgi:hypothetical protein
MKHVTHTHTKDTTHMPHESFPKCSLAFVLTGNRSKRRRRRRLYSMML